MKLLLLLVGVSVAYALPRVGPVNCIGNCKCENLLPNMLRVLECQEPLTINSTLLGQLYNKMKVMKFSNVIIDEIKEDAFKRFPLLEDVIIEKAQIGSIDKLAFDNITKVQFADCGFEDEPVLVSNRMQELHFGECRLDKIPPLDNLFTLKFLNLSGNYIRDVAVTDFAELFNLETLHLSNNELSRIVGDVFVNNIELNSLYLDNNPLKLFALNTSNSLETLSLNNCFLTSFGLASSQRLVELNELNLHNNKITNLHAEDLAPMRSLQTLILSNNSLTRLDDNIFSGNAKLQKVVLDGNNFETLPNFTLTEQTNFEIYYFSCKSCGLKYVNYETFTFMPAIVTLNLSYNNLTNIKGTLIYIKSLVILDLSFNNLKLSIGDFDSNRNLEFISLAGNPLLKLSPELFQFNEVLSKLDVSNCGLIKLWNNSNSTVKLNSLKNLYLANNELTTLSVSDFEKIPELQIIDLHNNPLVFNETLCNATNYLNKQLVALVENQHSNDLQMIDTVDNFVPNNWDKLLEGHCLNFDDDEADDDDDDQELNSQMQDYINESTFDKDVEDTKNEDIDDDDDDDDEDNYEELDYDDDDYKSEVEDDYRTEYNDNKVKVGAVEDEKVNLARVSYILSITSVFVLTALSVLIMAVVITLCVLRRNNNLHRANLPRFKIPRLQSHYEKKHSGSIYKPLSEEVLPGPETPKVKRYEFPTVNPTVHTTQ